MTLFIGIVATSMEEAKTGNLTEELRLKRSKMRTDMLGITEGVRGQGLKMLGSVCF